MEKIIKENGKIYLVTSNDGTWRHINKRTIGTYDEKPIEKIEKAKKHKKKEIIVENEKSED